MGIILIMTGLAVAYFWARDFVRGLINPIHARPIHEKTIGILPYLIAIALIAVGIYISFK